MSDDKTSPDVPRANDSAQADTTSNTGGSGKSGLEALLSTGLLLGGAVLAANVIDSLTSGSKSRFAPGAVGNVNSLGKAIRQRREDLGLTQDRLATKSGVGVRFISEVENGKGTAEIAKIIQLIDELGLQLSISTRA